ncbi:MAG: DEAD/DEAH box helicase [Deltaproteobacteria bacterium]|nr:MAG: DEAD/DEAH box helicase [Deltaproteobacteria bacterium]
MELREFFEQEGWRVVHQETRAAKKGAFSSYSDLGLSEASHRALKEYKDGIYTHQHEGISRYLGGDNLAITTATASGKSLVFNVCALEELSRNPSSRILAVYPLKALATEQKERWEHLVKQTGIYAKVGRIDGGVAVSSRMQILKESRILVMTPDIIHAWLFYNASSSQVVDFFKNLSLVIIDEAHTYSGVFGSNSAFLFRRLQHASSRLGGKLKFIASSATMADAQEHLAQLTGQPFSVVGQELDTSPRYPLTTLLVDPPQTKDILTVMSDLINFVARETSHQSITFVDSRKQTEYLASVIDRTKADDDDKNDIDFVKLKELQIYPYRSGYEEDDRQQIQKKLAAGQLKGVVSTSALEMGIDLPYLSLGILLGIPRSATSFFQRVGRVGRRKEGVIVIVNNGSVVSEAIMRNPELIKSLPLAKSALYLHNPRIQYIHAMCLARPGGEDEIIGNKSGGRGSKFTSPVDMPKDFVELCNAERIGEIATELQSMKSQAGDDPYHAFPLRDLDVQYQVTYKKGPTITPLGSLSQAQVMREAYPGAVYFYQTQSYRVTKIKKQQKNIEVRPEKRYFTTPTMLPTVILPNMGVDNVYGSLKYCNFYVVECNMQIAEAVIGFKERRGNNELDVKYPLDPTLGLFYDAPKFARYSFTSGVLFTHPALDRDKVKVSDISKILLEAFLMTLPFERQDISSGVDKYRSTKGFTKEGSKFVCLYDQTYGSLRLTGHLMEDSVLKHVFALALDIAEHDQNYELNSETFGAIREMAESLSTPPEECEEQGVTDVAVENFVRVILPGSIGVNVEKDDEEFNVERVFYSPQIGGLAYRGKHLMEKNKAERENNWHGPTTITVPHDHIRILEGESKVGYYNLETGEILESLPVEGEF